MTRKCPICKRPTDSGRDVDFPFCSDRCRLLDLGAWSAEKYVVSDTVFDEDDLAEIERQTTPNKKPDDVIH